jgi:hypothetical protein
MFPWYLNQSSVQATGSSPYISPYGVENTVEAPQFIHTFIEHGTPQSEHARFINSLANKLMLIENIRTDKPLRVKANLNLQIPNSLGRHYTKHIDVYENSKLKKITEDVITCIYYVNDCDGDTVFFNNSGEKEIGRVSPKKGRVVYFPVNTPHAGQPPTLSDRRCVINFNLLQKDI